MRDQLRELMATPLPSITAQRKKIFRPTLEEVYRIYDLLNHFVFADSLGRPEIKLERSRHYGLCEGYLESEEYGHHVEITVSPFYHCVQWCIMILAHEMSHQYQWEVDGAIRLAENKEPLMSHGPSFYKFSRKLREYGIRLKVTYSSQLWLRTQTHV